MIITSSHILGNVRYTKYKTNYYEKLFTAQSYSCMSHKHEYGNNRIFEFVPLLIETVIKGLKGHIKKESLKDTHSKMLSLICTKFNIHLLLFCITNCCFLNHIIFCQKCFIPQTSPINGINVC